MATVAARWPPARYPILELARIQAEIDELCFGLYGIYQADLRRTTTSISGGSGEVAEPDEPDADAAGGDEDDEGRTDTPTVVADLVSWAVGVAFGRFDVRLATGARALPAAPEPFDALPICSPAMLNGGEGLPLDCALSGYSHSFPENGILVDDAGHGRDLVAASHAVFGEVFGANADALWDEIANLLNPGSHDLRAWLATNFFEHHLKRYSMSRRKAPIYWQIGVPSARYSIWLYAHRLTRHGLFEIQNDVLAPKLAHEERQLMSIVEEAGDSPPARTHREIEAQQRFVEELRALFEEVRRVAPLWNPSLDDGVVLAMAPLWRLVPQHRAWQQELKAKWDELVAGKYDWAHIAMHLWPERVVPKCAEDRSLAIAHGLEEVFWFGDVHGRWLPRMAPTRPTDDLVRERTSPAVKAALKSLLEAPEPAGAARRGRRTRAA